MSRNATLITLCTAGALAACVDSTGPPFDPLPSAREVVVADGVLRPLVWGGSLLGLEAVGGSLLREVPAGGVAGLAAVADLPVETFQVSFWAVRHESREVQIYYRTSSGSQHNDDDDAEEGHGVRPFLRLVVPRGALRRGPDGSRISKRDSVLITVTVDRSRIQVDLQPDGLQFKKGKPALLQIWYGGAGGDLNGDGVVDGADAAIERDRLGLWFQAEPGGSWYRLAAEHSLSGQWFLAELRHFSGYEVSY